VLSGYLKSSFVYAGTILSEASIGKNLRQVSALLPGTKNNLANVVWLL
jgi:hypothetical protein